MEEFTTPTAFPGARILVADDEPGIRRTLLDLFRRVGYRPAEATSGTEALQKIRSEPFDLVLLDLNMPGMSGTTVLAEARPYAPDTVFIILTGYATLDSAIIALRHWAYDYLFKPSSLREILRVVENGLAARQQRTLPSDPVTLLERALATLKSAPTDVGDATEATSTERFLRAPGITVDLQKGLAMVANNAVSLTPTELKILVYLMRRSGEVVSLRELGAHLQGGEVTLYEARDLLRAPLHRLRHKIEVDPNHPRFIHTVRGRGYVFEVR
ncbi:MAG TPA: response regulator transcription factor [Anaerolineae bacterium]|nr:response regulator transcription factor [Anaerolineae bacterium]HQK12824.1 response regulator transcription factor [Anaerolineae bacterium]